MNIQYRFKVFIAYLKAKKFIKSQKDLGEKLGYESESAFSQVVNSKVNFSETLYPKLKTLYPFLNLDWLKYEDGPMIYNMTTNKEDALRDLNRIKNRKKSSDQSEGRLINESDLVAVEQYNIPIPGQAGIKKAFFYPDEYINEHFEKEVIFVRPEDRATYHKIEVDGDSMPGILDPGDWARCVDIPKNLWLEKGTFKPEKIYCLFHKDLGILFKRISKVVEDRITLSSENTDKNEYPDRTFQLMEFSKILIVKMKEVML